MKKGLYLATFVAGAVIGSMATWFAVKKKYEKIAQVEIDSVKEVFARKEEQARAKSVSEIGQEVTKDLSNGAARMAAEQAKDKPDLKAYYDGILQQAGYANYATGGNKEKGENVIRNRSPYVIPPEEFGEFEDYEKISLTYYADGILADDNDETVDDVEDIVGDALNHFGEYEDDSVFVRCDERKCDYEILLDQRTFSEVADNNPGKVEV